MRALYTTAQYSSGNTTGHGDYHSGAGVGTAQHCVQPRLAQYAYYTVLADNNRPAGGSVQDAVVVVGAGAGEGGAVFIPGQRAGVVGRGKAEGAGALQPVLQAPAEEGGLFGDLAGFGALVVVVIGQADHGVGFGQVSAEGGALRRLDREREIIRDI